jgi:hypothetical protein
MIRRPAGCLGIDPAKSKRAQIELVDKDVNRANGIVLADPVFQAFRKQRALTAIRPLNEALHLIPPQIAGIISRESNPAARFYTARVKSSGSTMSAVAAAFPESGHSGSSASGYR